MAGWQEFEQACCNYLNKTYGNNRVRFESDGGSDSTSSDIKAFVDGVNRFNIEVKSSAAQSGQFVVLNADGKLIFSPENDSEEKEAEPFLVYMNAHYDTYKTATTAGKKLDMDKSEFNKWIVDHYLDKNELFVITSNGDDFIIFPTEKYGEYFDTTCNYRIKKSGSGHVPKKYAEDIKKLFNCDSYKYIDNKKLYLHSSSALTIKSKKTKGDYDYYVSKSDGNGYYCITRLSNTRNANVIFSIRVKKNQAPEDIAKFKEALK